MQIVGTSSGSDPGQVSDIAAILGDMSTVLVRLLEQSNALKQGLPLPDGATAETVIAETRLDVFSDNTQDNATLYTVPANRRLIDGALFVSWRTWNTASSGGRGFFYGEMGVGGSTPDFISGPITKPTADENRGSVYRNGIILGQGKDMQLYLQLGSLPGNVTLQAVLCGTLALIP